MPSFGGTLIGLDITLTDTGQFSDILERIKISYSQAIRNRKKRKYDRNLRPLVIVEYKAPEVAVTQKVFDQIARYNTVLEAPSTASTPFEISPTRVSRAQVGPQQR